MQLSLSRQDYFFCGGIINKTSCLLQNKQLFTSQDIDL